MAIKKEVIIDDIHLTYYELGEGNPLLFLHGGRLRAMTFQSTLKELAKKHRVIAPDIPGYGDSSTPETYWTYENYANFFRSFLNRLEIKNVIVIGYSLGGGIAYHLASKANLISQLIIIDASGIEKSQMAQFERDFRRLFFYFTHPQYLLTFLILMYEYVLFVRKNDFNLRHIHQMRKELEDSSSVNTISVPTHIIWAKNDEIFPVEIAHKLQKLIHGSTIEIVDENHDWPLCKSKTFNEVLFNQLT